MIRVLPDAVHSGLRKAADAIITSKNPRIRRDRVVVALGYCAATAAAALTIALVDAHPLVQVLIADVAATVVIFVCSVAHRNSSFYDPYWSVAPPIIGAWFIAIGTDADPLRQLIVIVLVWLWGLRLTANWASGWRGMAHRDWRYDRLESLSGRLWWPLSFAGVHLFPTLLVFAGCIALYPALAVGGRPPGWLDLLALLLGCGSVWLEFHADRELQRFRARRADSSELLDAGVWGWSRHPNYLGEIGFWVSLFLFGWSAHGGIYPWSWLGPVCMLGLFLLVSIPMIEARLEADKPAYAEYRARTPMLVPLGGRRRRTGA